MSITIMTTIITITMRTMTMMDMSMNTSIITMTTMSMNMSITTIMNMMNMNTTIITTVVAPAAMTMMPTMSSSAGALRRPCKYTEEEIHAALSGLDNAEQCGIVLRAKGIVPCTDGTWIHFDYVPGEQNVRRGPASFTGRLCVIGSELKEHELEHLFCLH